MTLTSETRIKTDRCTPNRFQGCQTFADLVANKTAKEDVAAYHYSQGWQIEVRSTTLAGRMKRVACFDLAN